MSLKRDSLKAAAAAIGASGLRFALFAALARLLHIEEVGSFALAQWVAEMTAMACSLGFTAIAPRYLPALRDKPSELSSFFSRWRKWSWAIIVLAGVVGLLVSRGFNSNASADLHVATGLWASAVMALALQAAILSGLLRYDMILRQNLTLGVVSLLLAIAVAGLNLGLTVLVAAMTLSAIIAIVCSRVSVQQQEGSSALANGSATPWRVDTQELRTYALNSWATSLMWTLAWSRGELPVLAHYVSREKVAQFTAATVIVGGAVQAIMMLVSAVGPHLTRLWFTDQKLAALNLAQTVMSMQLLISGLASLFLIAFGDMLLVFAFGSIYSEAGDTLKLLALYLPALSIAAQGHIVQLESNGRINRNLMIVAISLLYLTALLLIPRIGNEGAAIARILSMTAYGGLISIICATKFGLGSVATKNVILVISVLALAAFTEEQFTGMTARISLFCGFCAILLIFVRNSERRVVALLFGIDKQRVFGISRT